jgi:hypothetical protein
MKHSTCIAAALLLCAQAALAAGGGGGGSSSGGGSSGSSGTSSQARKVDPVVASARAAFARLDWVGARTDLEAAIAANPNSADYHNLYAYSIRKGPNPDMSLVFAQYQEALRIDPKHLGAHEYIGEAYLQINNLAEAKVHLAALDKICFFGCDEYTDLKKAVAAYESSHKTEASQSR